MDFRKAAFPFLISVKSLFKQVDDNWAICDIACSQQVDSVLVQVHCVLDAG
jgi:hypothetical protein